MSPLRLLPSVLLILSGCWADFPDSRFQRDSRPADLPPVVPDAPIVPDAPAPDGPAPDGPAPDTGLPDHHVVDAHVFPDGTGCPGVCTGGCQGTTCIMTCPNACTCPPGWDCEVVCGSNGCAGKVDCSLAHDCTVACGSGYSCSGGIFCGTGDCTVTCPPNACPGAETPEPPVELSLSCRASGIGRAYKVKLGCGIGGYTEFNDLATGQQVVDIDGNPKVWTSGTGGGAGGPGKPVLGVEGGNLDPTHIVTNWRQQ